MSDGRAGNKPSLNQSAWQLSARSLFHIVSLRRVIAFGEATEKDITKDRQQKIDESRFRPCQERVISHALSLSARCWLSVALLHFK